MTGSPQTLGPSSVIGPGIFGLVTVGMYDNPLAIYREYIQNSADAISGIAAFEGGKVEITIDRSERRIKIQDNGPGLSLDDSLKQLVPIGRSSKRVGSDRGFRGIGRLAGLAFAETVTFTTRTRTDEMVTRVTWYSSRLPGNSAGEAAVEDMVRDCVDVETLSGRGYPDHFFEVELSGVERHAAGPLLNRDAVRSYLSEVCPVPVAKVFPYSQRVESLLKHYAPQMSLDITLDGDLEPVKRPYGKNIQLSANREDEFTEFEEVQIPNVDRTADAAVGWIAHSSYLGAIPKGNQIRGIRARVGNIQIGDETVFDSLYSEERFNRWCVGELYILDHRIVPNARRDYFEPGPHLRNLENHLLPVLKGISVRSRTASSARNKARRVLSALSSIEETRDLVMSGYLPAIDAGSLAKEALEQLPRLRELLLKLGLGEENIERLDGVEGELLEFDKNPYQQPLNGIGPAHRTVYRQVFHALTEVASSPRAARDLMAAIVAQTSDANNNGSGRAQ